MEPIEISPNDLQPETLRRLVEEFVSREGTDYGLGEYSLADKVTQVIRSLHSKRAQIFFDPKSETCNIVTTEQLL